MQYQGQLLIATDVVWKKVPGSLANISLENGSLPERNDSLFRSDFNFEQMGIGGLDEQFKKMFRTAFASRIFPGLVKQLGRLLLIVWSKYYTHSLVAVEPSILDKFML